jgi:hypothetical protein
MAEGGERFDDVLMGLAAQLGGIDPLLRTFFSFLHRKTDFYVVADFKQTPQATMGFPRGAAERLLLQAFRSFPEKRVAGQPALPKPPAVEPVGEGGEADLLGWRLKQPHSGVI